MRGARDPWIGWALSQGLGGLGREKGGAENRFYPALEQALRSLGGVKAAPGRPRRKTPLLGEEPAGF